MTVSDQAGPLLLDQPLSTALREGSRLEHQAAEDSPFMARLVAGEVGVEGYAAYLLRLREVYAALESVGQAHRDLPAVAAVLDPALDRLAAIDADLDYWSPGGARAVDSPAAAAYGARVRASVDLAAGGGYVAHHYTRYLGDLSGGQVVGRVLTRQFDLAGDGVAFYNFPAIPKPKPYKDAYRARLDALPLTAAERATVVEEVRVAFSLNQALFAELG